MYFIDPEDEELIREIGDSDASSNALQNFTVPKKQRNLSCSIMKITLLEKVWVHQVITIWYTNSFLCLKQWKHQMQRQQWKKNGKIKENFGMAADESQKQRWGDRWSKEKGRKSSFCVIHGSLSSQDFGVGPTSSKIQRSSRTPRWHCERWFRIVCCIHWARIISITNDGCKSNGHEIMASRMFRTSSWCSIC